MMKKVLIYFHGFGSNEKSDKVEKLKNMGYETIAFNIDVNPKISIQHLINSIDDWLVENLNREDIDIWFVGTSLGAWYANLLGKVYDTKTILINPCLDPYESLKLFGVQESILNGYKSNNPTFTKLDHVVVSNNDKLFDFSEEKFVGANVVYRTDLGNHRFNGPEFDMFVKKILESNP